MSSTAAPAPATGDRALGLVQGLPHDLAAAKLLALRRALLLRVLAITVDADARELSAKAREHYGDDAIDGLGLDGETSLYDLDGSELLGQILTDAEAVIANGFGQLDEPDLDLTPEREIVEQINALRDGPLGRAARGEDLPAEQRLAIALDQIEGFRASATMAHAILEGELLGNIR